MKTAFLVLLLQVSAHASISTKGVFSGDLCEGFQGLASNNNLSIFGGAASLNSNAGVVSSNWSFLSTILPFEGDRFYGSADGPATIIFDPPVKLFGGYFGTNSVDENTNAPDATANFFDTTDSLISSEPVVLGDGGTWNWNGWQADAGKSIQRVEIVGPTLGGAFVHMDALKASGAIPEPTSLLVWGLIGCCVANRHRFGFLHKQ